MGGVVGCLKAIGVLAVCLLLGLAGGAVVGWVVWPVDYVDNELTDLKSGYQDDYIVMVADAYQLDSHLERAMARLDQLEEPAIARRVASLVRAKMAGGEPKAQIRPLVNLAAALGAAGDDMLEYAATATPSPVPPEPTPIATLTPESTRTETPAPLPTMTAVPQISATPSPRPTHMRLTTAVVTASAAPVTPGRVVVVPGWETPNAGMDMSLP